jgi:hypothetical protein
MRHLGDRFARLGLAAMLTAAVAIGAAAPAFAADVTGTVSVTGGSLAMAASEGPAFGAVALNGSAQTKTDTVPIDVKDFRGSGAGWNLQITSTQFSAGAGVTLPADATTILATTAACDNLLAGCTVAANTILTPVAVPAGATAPTAVKFFSTPALTGMGDFTVTPSFSLRVPADALAGDYASTMTITVGNAP